jgi:hypothetical protein
MENLQAIVDQEPGPGAYHDEERHSSFSKKIKRIRYHEDFALKQDRFEKEDLTKSPSPGPGFYSEVTPEDVGFNRYVNKRGKKVPFDSQAPRMKQPRKNEFGEIDEDYITPAPGYSANLENDPKMIMAQLRKDDILRQKSDHIRKVQMEKNEAYGPFRKKLKRERRQVPDPGFYHKSKSVAVTDKMPIPLQRK